MSENPGNVSVSKKLDDIMTCTQTVCEYILWVVYYYNYHYVRTYS